MNIDKESSFLGNIKALRAQVDEIDTTWKCNWKNFKQEKYYLVYNHVIDMCMIDSTQRVQRVGALYMSKVAARRICKSINKKIKKNKMERENE